MATINPTLTVFLIDPENVRAVRCRYEAPEHAATTMFKTMDKTIVKDDLVLIPTNTRHGFTVVKVTELDVEVDINSPVPIQWIAAKLDLTDHFALLANEKVANSQINHAQAIQQRKKLLADLAESSGLDIQGLTIGAKAIETGGTV